MYITEYRAKVVDFTRPFMNVYGTMLLRKPPNGHPSHIQTVSDIINQSEIKYGTVDTGILLRTFRNTNDSVIKIMWRNMGRFKPRVLTKTNDEGIQKVRKEKFAFVLPNTIGDYIAMRAPCDLITVDKFLKTRGYGLALQKDSPLISQINSALSTLDQDGTLDRIYYKWWIAPSECSGIKSSRVYSVNSSDKLTQTLLPVICTFILLQRRHYVWHRIPTITICYCLVHMCVYILWYINMQTLKVLNTSGGVGEQILILCWMELLPYIEVADWSSQVLNSVFYYI